MELVLPETHLGRCHGRRHAVHRNVMLGSLPSDLVSPITPAFIDE